MAIEFRLAVLMAERKMKLKDLAETLNITQANASHLKTGKIKALKLKTLEKLCFLLDCQPGDLMEYQPKSPSSSVVESPWILERRDYPRISWINRASRTQS